VQIVYWASTNRLITWRFHDAASKKLTLRDDRIIGEVLYAAAGAAMRRSDRGANSYPGLVDRGLSRQRRAGDSRFGRQQPGELGESLGQGAAMGDLIGGEYIPLDVDRL
jgi:hypothetical protein